MRNVAHPPRPATGVSGWPFRPEVFQECPRECPRKRGVSKGVSHRPSGPISRDIAILSLQSRDGEVSTPPKWRDTPPWYLVSHKHICAIPHFATYRAIIVRYPIKKQAQKSFAILSLQASRDMKSIAAGPLSPQVVSGALVPRVSRTPF